MAVNSLPAFPAAFPLALLGAAVFAALLGPPPAAADGARTAPPGKPVRVAALPAAHLSPVGGAAGGGEQFPGSPSDLLGSDPAMAAPRRSRGIPVILDTDIGTDIDDTWALALLLRSPELDLKLVVTDTGNTTYRAKIVAKLLDVAGRGDIPVGIGIKQGDGGGGQEPWVRDYDLARHRGGVLPDGVDALIHTIMTSRRPITLIAIGPVPNLKEALRREPRIATRARFVGMDGSIYKGYGGGAPAAEYNIAQSIPAAQAAFTAAWPMTITPLDTCGTVQLRGDQYQAVATSTDPLARAVIESYRVWANKTAPDQAPHESSTLFDTVAVYLAISHDLVKIEHLRIRVTDDGFTRIDPAGKPIDCATAWKDRDAYEDLLVARLTGKPAPARHH